jgi:hypothetical protein
MPTPPCCSCPRHLDDASRFTAVSGTSHSILSMLIRRHGLKNAPPVSRSTTGLATCESSSALGSAPSRCRACVIPDVGVRSHDSSQPPSPPASPPAGPPLPRNLHQRTAPSPGPGAAVPASGARPLARRLDRVYRHPRRQHAQEIQSVRRPPGTKPVCVVTRNHTSTQLKAK